VKVSILVAGGKDLGFGKGSLFPGCKEGVHLGKEEWGVWKGGLCPPSFEPGSWAWGAHMLPLHHWRRHK